jgi:hypothetical protein
MAESCWLEGYLNAGNRYIAVRGVQGAELLDNQEQKDDHRPSGVQEVL